MESTLFKITGSVKDSGIFYGPMTAVYGVGIIAILLLNKYFLKKIKCNKIIKYLIEFIVLTLVLTLIEFIGGNVLNYLFDIDMWNYTKKTYNFGKYVCLELALTWGVMGILFIHIFKPFTDKILSKVTDKEVYLFLSIFLVDLSLVLVTKL